MNLLRNISICCIYLFLYIPILVLVTFSFNQESFPSPWTQFTFKWYRELFLESTLWHAFGNSSIIAVSATTLTLMIGMFLLFYASQGGKIQRILNLFYGNIIIPETVLAISLMSFFTTLSIPLGFTSLVVAHTVLGLGFFVPLIYGRFIDIDQKLIEASLDLGASPFETFYKITLPILKTSLISSALLIFVLSFDDFILSYFCAGSSTQTLSLYILSMLRSGVSPVINALSTFLLFMSSLLVYFYFSLESRPKRGIS